MAGCLLDISIHPAVLGGSLRFCEQPAVRLKARSRALVKAVRLAPSVSGRYTELIAGETVFTLISPACDE